MDGKRSQGRRGPPVRPRGSNPPAEVRRSGGGTSRSVGRGGMGRSEVGETKIERSVRSTLSAPWVPSTQRRRRHGSRTPYSLGWETGESPVGTRAGARRRTGPSAGSSGVAVTVGEQGPSLSEHLFTVEGRQPSIPEGLSPSTKGRGH